MISRYKNNNELDSTINELTILLYLKFSIDQDTFSIPFLQSFLEDEISNQNSERFHPNLILNICDKRFFNEKMDNPFLGQSFIVEKDFKYRVNDFEVLYESDCIDNDILYLDISLEGMLYHHVSSEITDSIYINRSEFKLLFDI